jgi:aspartyl-tRNA(Asn)/glutamyl-tRNA(Gln) amidotransferase subunit B
MELSDKYETVIGLEIHAQLSTDSKLFSGDSATPDEDPNTRVSNITLGHPGTLPRTNKQAVVLAIRMGIACNCDISQHNFFARKNYFYPDLPKGYQVSQHTVPICKGGVVSVWVNDEERFIKLNRIHLEEDAGKSIHDVDAVYTCIDHNRAGTPLIEIVTEPCISTAEEACQYVATVRKWVRWLNVSNGNMEQGNLRCDANISIRREGETVLGTKVEVKNLNSIRNLRKAIEFEVERMVNLIESGETIVQQTRSFDASTDTTFSLRDKEDANDYRYFADPDLAPFNVSIDVINTIKKSMPMLPSAFVERFQKDLGLSRYDSIQLTEDREFAEYFISLTEICKNYKAAANWMNGPIKQYLNEKNISITEVNLSPAALAELIALVEENKVAFSVASSTVLNEIIVSGTTAMAVMMQHNLFQVNNVDELSEWIDAAINKMPDKVLEYRKGKKGLIGLFVGEVKRISRGKADPKLVNELLEQKLNRN